MVRDEHITVIGGVIPMGNWKHYKGTGRIRPVARIVILVSLFSVSLQAQNRMPPIPDEEMTEA